MTNEIEDLKRMILYMRKKKTAEEVARDVGVTRDVIMRMSRGVKVAKRTAVKVTEAFLRATEVMG